MLQSQLFLKTRKEAPKDDPSVNAQLLIRGGYIDKLMSGVYSFLPLGFLVLKKIENIIREEMLKAGGQEILMPVLQPKENWSKTGRWDTYDTLFKFISHYTKNEYALGPTHEEIISPLAGKFLSSHKDLPAYLFQIQTKFRDEKRAKSGILRGREFIMKDLYSFHKDEKDMNDYYEKMKDSYKNIFEACGIGEQTYLTFASGGSFSKYSHEYQTVTEAGEDIIFICRNCKVAVNKEIINEQNACPECGNKDLIEKKAIEVGNIFPLKTKFSKPFGLKFTDENGGQKDIIMGCYGIGLGRLMGAIVEVNNDKYGIIWPKKVAPFDLHLMVLESKDEKMNKQVFSQALEIYKQLSAAEEGRQQKPFSVLYDDRKGLSAGEKFSDADLIGAPLRVVISAKTLAEGKVEVKERGGKEMKLVDINQIVQFLKF